MIITLNEVTKRVQALLDDPTGSQFDSGYLANFINQRFDDMAIELVQLDLTFEEVVAVINPLAANTTDLSTQEADGGTLEAILEPTCIEWKRVGDDDDKYVEVAKKGKMPDVAVGTEGVTYYEWRGGIVYLSQSSIAVVLRVRYHAMSTNLVDATDKIIRGATNVLVYKVAELVAAVRGGDGGAKLAQRYGAMGREAMDNFEVMAVKNNQIQTFRMGRTSRSRRFRPYVAR